MSLKTLLKTATDFDYSSEVLCEEPGQFSIRGGLIDVYPVNSDKLARPTFWEMRLKKSNIRPQLPAGRWNSFEIIISSAHSEAQDEVAGEFFEYLKRPVFWFFRELSIYLIPSHWFFTSRRRPKILNHLCQRIWFDNKDSFFLWYHEIQAEWESLMILNTCKTRSVY